jgi:hypothetical protein
VLRPHRVIGAFRDIITADPNAIVASRIFDSRASAAAAYQPVPESAGIGDVAFLTGLGYRTFMFGDKVCFQRGSIIEALNLLEAVAGEF